MNLLDSISGEQAAAAAVTIVLQVTFVLAVTCGVAYLMRRNAAARHAICLAGLVLAVACPLLAVNGGPFGWTWLLVAWPVEETETSDSEFEPRVIDEPDLNADLPTQKELWTPADDVLLTRELESPTTESITVPPDVLYRPGDADPPQDDEQLPPASATSTVPLSPDAVASSPAMASGDPETAARADSTTINYAAILRVGVGYGLLAWLLGVIVQTVRWWIGCWRLKSMLYGTVALDPSRFGDVIADATAEVGLGRPPRILAGPLVPIPLVHGVIHPRVLLPGRFVEEAKPFELRDVLIHEFAHVARRDSWISQMQRLIGVLYWPHPLLHVLNRQLSAAREELCDNHVLRAGRGAAFAEMLLSLSEQVQAVRVPVGLLGLVSRGRLEARIAGLLDRQRRTGTRMRRSGVALLVVAGLALLCVTVGIRAGDRPFESEEAAIVESSGDALESSRAGDGGESSSDQDQSEHAERHIRGVVTDENGAPVSRAVVRFAMAGLRDGQCVSDGQGGFRLPLPSDQQRRSWELLASGPAAERLGFVKVRDPQDRGDLSVQVMIRPAQVVIAHVQDDLGRPVPGAIVTAVGEYCAVGEGVTGVSGSVTVHYPDGMDIEWLLARRDGVGFDYFENYSSTATLHPGPLPNDVTLRLDGARSVEVQVVDSDGEPVTNAEVYPWSIHNSGKARGANLSGTLLFPVDAGGTARLDWLPPQFENGVPFIARVPGAHTPAYPILKAENDEDHIRIEVLRDARLLGRVLYPDGKPAAGIRIIGSGEGYSPYSGREATTRTDEDGRYELPVESNAAYLVAVQDDEWAAKCVSTALLDEDEILENLDLTLVPGTVVTGQVTERDAFSPVVDEYVTLSLEGERLPAITARSVGLRRLYYRTRTDEAGRYAFRVGPGEYRLRIRGESPHGREPLQIAGSGGRLVFDQHFEAPQWLSLTGRIVNSVDDSPLADATVYVGAAGDDDGPTLMFATTDREGQFRIDRGWPENLVYAHSADRALASFMIVDHETSDVTLALYPAVTVVGHLLDHTGKPLANVEVAGHVRSPNAESESAAIRTITDENGRYRIPGVAVGARFKLVPMRRNYLGASHRNPVRIFSEPGEVEIDPFVVPRTSYPTDPDRISETRQQVLREIEQSRNDAERRTRLRQARIFAEDLLVDRKGDRAVQLNAAILLASLNARGAQQNGEIERPPVPYVAVHPLLLSVLQDESYPEPVRMWAGIGLGRICRDADRQVRGGELEELQREQIALALVRAVEEKFDPAAAEDHSTDETSLTAHWYEMRLVEALGITGTSGESGERVVRTLIDVMRRKNLGLYARGEAARGLGRLPVEHSDEFGPRLTAIAGMAVQLAEAPRREGDDSSVHRTAGHVHLAFKPINDSEAARGWGLLTQASRFEGDAAAAEVDRLYQLILRIVSGILKNQNIPQGDVDALKMWLAERGEDDDQNSDAPAQDGNASINPQSVIDSLAERCHPWINTPADSLRSLQYTYTLGNDERLVELVRGVSEAPRSMWQGTTLNTGLHWLLRHDHPYAQVAVTPFYREDTPESVRDTLVRWKDSDNEEVVTEATLLLQRD